MTSPIQPNYHYRRTYTGPVTTVIFDWAGTVLDFGCIAPVAAFRQVFSDIGVAISEVEAREPMGAAKREHVALILQMPAVQARWRAVRGSASTEADVDALYAEFLRVDEKNVATYSDLIPGALDTMLALRSRGIRIGSTTGYPREVMKNLIPIARDKGYVPDYCCTVSDVPRGRPYPDMCLDNALVLMASDVRGCVVVDDSPSGLEAGLAAGMWTVAIAASGNEIGLDLASWRALGAQERATLLAQARQRLARTGTHYVIDTIADLMPVITQIEARMAQGEQP